MLRSFLNTGHFYSFTFGNIGLGLLFRAVALITDQLNDQVYSRPLDKQDEIIEIERLDLNSGIEIEAVHYIINELARLADSYRRIHIVGLNRIDEQENSKKNRLFKLLPFRVQYVQ